MTCRDEPRSDGRSLSIPWRVLGGDGAAPFLSRHLSREPTVEVLASLVSPRVPGILVACWFLPSWPRGAGFRLGLGASLRCFPMPSIEVRSSPECLHLEASVLAANHRARDRVIVPSRNLTPRRSTAQRDEVGHAGRIESRPCFARQSELQTLRGVFVMRTCRRWRSPELARNWSMATGLPFDGRGCDRRNVFIWYALNLCT